MTRAGNGSRRTDRGRQNREAILAAAVSRFAESGYRGASLASIAAAVGLTQQGVLHYFPSKEALLLALLDEKYHEDGRRLSASLEHDGLDVLRALQSLVEHNAVVPDRVRLFSALVAESLSSRHPAHAYFVRRYGKVRERMLRSLQMGQRSGEIREDVDLERVVPLIAAVMDGLQVQWLLDPEVDMVSSFALFVDLFKQILIRAQPDPARANGVAARRRTSRSTQRST
jgi:AcrR family transcriptional regulator